MRIDGKKIVNGKKTYMWVYRNSPFSKSPPIVLFDWQPSRRADHPRDFLKNFSGAVITDGYQVYHKLDKERQDLNVAGCWIHYVRTIIIPDEMPIKVKYRHFFTFIWNNNTMLYFKNPGILLLLSSLLLSASCLMNHLSFHALI
ncbi:MAG: IS66 family transposase, partial [Lachnospiraceae bacterium]|nr:IS66 family transposase [Lachnospiraceae bacterium]